jgi:hypothetical protein
MIMTPQYERGLNQFGHRDNGPPRVAALFAADFRSCSKKLRCDAPSDNW